VVLLAGASSALVAPPPARAAALRMSGVASAGTATALPPPLAKLVAALAGLPDDKYRYKQLLHWGETAPALDAALKVDANKVPGCLSTVHVSVVAVGDGTVSLAGDSDAQLTKGLVVLLVKGLDGATPAEIAAVDPSFIKDARVAASMTPGRNNGFVNMLAVIKRKAAALEAGNGAAPPPPPPQDADLGPVAAEVRDRLSALKPSAVAVVDASDGAEAALTVTVVADCFAGLAPEKRDALVRAVLGDAAGSADLEICAETPAGE
jgi:sulfur transfer protein SufE/stress-induced morphogen